MLGKNAYIELTAMVSKINKGAARYMRKHAPNLKCFSYTDELNGCFVWYDTPQGHNFWEEIWWKVRRV